MRVGACIAEGCEAELAEPLANQGQRFGEGAGVVAVARVGLVAEREVAVERHAEGEPDQAQVMAPALRVPAAGERVALVGVDEGGEVGRVVDERAQLDLEALDRAGDDLRLGRACDDPLGKRLAKRKEIARLSTPQLAAEMVAVGELSHKAGAEIFVASAGGADPRHFNNAVKLALEALEA